MTLIDHLAHYASYHRDARNINTHFVGIPLIVWAIVVLLSRPVFEVGELTFTPAMVFIVLLFAWFYWRLDKAYALVLLMFYGLCAYSALAVAMLADVWWLAIGLGAFGVGWAIQFVGHYYEGKKPAFFDDVRGLFVGPLFVAAEWGFLWGFRLSLREAIEARVGALRYQGEVPRFSDFTAFYPHYLREHQNPHCRLLHYVGTWWVLCTLIVVLLTRQWKGLWLLPLIGYGFAWLGHFVFEKNRPATFRHPFYSLAGDWKMWWQMHRHILQGKVAGNFGEY